MTAFLWELPLLSLEILKENVTCITFGQPVIGLPHVKEIVQCTPEFESIIHSIFFEDDIIPRVMSFLDVECDRMELTVTLDSYEPLKYPWDVSVTVYSISKTPNHTASNLCITLQKFQGPFTSMVFHHLSRIEQVCYTVGLIMVL